MRIASGTPVYAQREEALFMVFNGGNETLSVTLPAAPAGWVWRLHVDTDRPLLMPAITPRNNVQVAAQSVRLYELERDHD